MSKQWGHGFHTGRCEGAHEMILRIGRDGSLSHWINHLQEGEVIFRKDWDSDRKRLYMRNGILLICEDGEERMYEMTEADLSLEWFGFSDGDEFDEEGDECCDEAEMISF